MHCPKNYKKYYDKNKHKLIKVKTLFKCEREGRIPRHSTLTTHDIHIEEVLTALTKYVTNNGESERVKKYMQHHESCIAS